MNRAIHAETLKARLDDDGHLSGYLDEMINDCPSVKPDLNSVVDEVFTADIVNGKWKTEEETLERLTMLRKEWRKRSACAGRLDDAMDALPECIDSIFLKLQKGSRAEFQAELEKFDTSLIAILRTVLSCAGFLHIDVEKYLRGEVNG